ncbi:MAG: hypothetical protein AAGF56_15345, partial [Pseudomonadota bacterium]
MTGFTPFELQDPLPNQNVSSGSTIGTERLRLVEGLMLSASHFEVEQLYHRSRLSRLLACLHGQGTVCGLNVSYQSVPIIDGPGDQLELKVSPGLAVDGAGRLIELRFESCVVLQDWVDEQAADPDGQNALQSSFVAGSGSLPDHVVIDVTAGFATYAHRPEPAFATGNADRIDSVEPSLSVDSCRLSLVIRTGPDTTEPVSEIASALPSDPVTIEQIQEQKRTALWDDLTGPDQAPVHLARLAVPAVLTGSALSFDASFDMLSVAVAPDFAHR